MSKAVGVRFREAGRIYNFSTDDPDIKIGDNVIVETVRGVEMGEVATGLREFDNDRLAQPLKEVIRVATDEDRLKVEENNKKAKEALAVCKEKIKKHGLEMKLIDCEYTFDNTKMLFYFTADGRIDFRELVKDLASVFHTRIELRQVGVRDETKILGGIGVCGRPLCCHTFLTDFAPVSIKMANEQGLSLNAAKISGVCGRLMCCLKNEEAVYEELNDKLPSQGDPVETPEGNSGIVSSVNILRQLVKVVVDMPNDEKEVREYEASELKFSSRRKNRLRESRREAEELDELYEMEKKDRDSRSELES